MPTTEQLIIEAAWRCVQRSGPRRTTVAEVAREASVARGTVYQYFPDKAALFEAIVRWSSADFLQGMGRAMTNGRTFHQQLGLAAAYVASSSGAFEQSRAAWGANRVAHGLQAHGADFLEECSAFLEPYLRAAAGRGEIEGRVDIPAASEWCARMLTSLFTTPSKRYDLTDPDTAGRYVSSFAMAGLASAAPAAPTTPAPGLADVAAALGPRQSVA